MTNILVEGGIDFYDELYKSLDNVEIDLLDDNDICLITKMPLTETHVKLDCGHKFNYDALYNDICVHKNKHNTMEKYYLKTGELRCPYCRNIQKKLLPVLEGYPKMHGVNYIDDTLSKPAIIVRGDAIGVCLFPNIVCTSKYGKIMQNNNTFYCWKHYNIASKNLIKEQIAKMKEEKKVAKLKELEEKKVAKLKELEEKKVEKLKELQEKKTKKNTENVVIGGSPTGCIHVLISGKNKGLLCSKICYEGSYCKTHIYKHLSLEKP
jgi:hypothetical protein